MIAAQRQIPGPKDISRLEVRHYGSAPGNFILYDDDGISYDYEKGAYSMTLLRVSKDRKGRWQGNQPVPPGGKPYHYAFPIVWQFMTH